MRRLKQFCFAKPFILYIYRVKRTRAFVLFPPPPTLTATAPCVALPPASLQSTLRRGLKRLPIKPKLPALLVLRQLDRGRTVSYPTAPSQIPACGTTAQGFSKLLTLHAVLIKYLEIMTDSWFSNFKVFYHFIKPFPIVASAL